MKSARLLAVGRRLELSGLQWTTRFGAVSGGLAHSMTDLRLQVSRQVRLLRDSRTVPNVSDPSTRSQGPRYLVFLHCVKGAVDFGIRYNRDEARLLARDQKLNVLYDLSDSDFAGCRDASRSTSGCVLQWISWNQNIVDCVQTIRPCCAAYPLYLTCKMMPMLRLMQNISVLMEIIRLELESGKREERARALRLEQSALALRHGISAAPRCGPPS